MCQGQMLIGVRGILMLGVRMVPAVQDIHLGAPNKAIQIPRKGVVSCVQQLLPVHSCFVFYFTQLDPHANAGGSTACYGSFGFFLGGTNAVGNG